MLSGRRLDLLDPSPLDVEMEDIAHGLARVARWNGQTKGAHIFSVAQHCLLVETIARQRSRLDRQGRLAVLLHDAPEYVIGDMISPFKAVIGDNYKAVEARLLAAIHIRFGLTAAPSAELLALIKAADQGAAYLEATKLAGFTAAEAGRFFGKPPELSAAALRDYLTPWPAETAEARFLERFARLFQYLTLSRHSPRAYKGRMIHVCSLSRLHRTVEETGARHVVTLLRDLHLVTRPECIAAEQHLLLGMDDIPEPADGYVAPGEEHVRKLIAFARGWDRSAPLVVHCYAGISRSTAAAFVTACALSPARTELQIAQELRQRSHTASPNRRIVSIADNLLGRNGRMVDAIEAIGPGAAATEAIPFRLELA